MMSNVVKIKRTRFNGIIPIYHTEWSAGADLHAVDSVDIPAGEWRAVDTGVSFAIPQGYEVQIRPRSGLAAKHGVTVLNAPGTIDSDYRGEIKVLLINQGRESFHITPGDRIAQMVLCKVYQADFTEVLELDETERGDGGFESTGRN